MTDLARWRAIAAKAKRQYEEMSGFPGSGYVSSLGGNLDQACDYIERLEGAIRESLSVELPEVKPYLTDWDCPKARNILTDALRPSGSGGAGQDRSPGGQSV